MDENQRIALKVAQLYYESELTQDEISKKLRLSRPKVSRLLQEARDAGFVKITVAPFPGSHTRLERSLEEKYGLLDVLAIDVSQPKLLPADGTANWAQPPLVISAGLSRMGIPSV